MKSKSIRIYADTSVFGGVFDPEFEKASAEFFMKARTDEYRIVTSKLVEDELEEAPDKVKNLFAEVAEYAEFIEPNNEAVALRDAYLKANIISPKCFRDALHVAFASVAECAIIISWNFKHIVNFRRIPLYVEVNISLGYKPIAIYSPMEVIGYEKEGI